MGQQYSKRKIKKWRLTKKSATSSTSTSITQTSSSQHTSSVTTYTHQSNGRRYVDDQSIPYPLPTDDTETDRVHQEHWILKDATQRNYQAPVEEALTKGINVLDSGCGPGTWVFEMAEDFPASQFYGVDIVPTFPESIKPKNVTFNVANITEPLPYPDAHFDYIYQRLMIFSLTKEQWQLAIRELVRKLRPGGTIELMEADCHWTNMGPLAQILNKAIIDLFIFRGLVPDVSEKMGTYCEDHGLRNVHIVRHRLTINHGGRIGALHWEDLKQMCVAMHPLFVISGHPEWEDTSKFHGFLDQCAQECAQYQTVIFTHSVYAEKPAAGS